MCQMNPLVSVPVITYNSEKTIIETLESIKEQGYQNIELIISDDASQDNTVELCESWICKNASRFKRTVLLRGEQNIGISKNLNRAEAHCRGDWVKGIAGDDLLFPDCVEKYVEYVNRHPAAVYVFGKIRCIGGTRKQRRLYEKNLNDVFFSVSADKQYELLMMGYTPSAPTAFYHRQKVAELGVVNDERIPLMEDLPKWVSLYRKGVRFYFLDDYVVQYRLGGISDSKLWDDMLAFQNLRLFWFYYVFADLYATDSQKAVEQAVEYEVNLMRTLKLSKSYRLGEFLLAPMKWIWGMCRRFIWHVKKLLVA